MDNLLSGLFGGNNDDDDQKQAERAGDFVRRVETGAPGEGVSTAEALQNYKNVAAKLPDSEYVDAARDALAKFTPQQRQEFGQLLSSQTGVKIQGDIDSPDEIAQLTNQLRSSGGGGGLAGLLGGSGGVDDIIGALTGGNGGSNDIMGALSGLLGGSGGPGGTASEGSQAAGMADLLKNPIVQAILAAIAAAAMKKYAGGGGGGLSGILGGGDAPAATAPKVAAAPKDEHDNDGGGILDALFGGGKKDDEPKPESKPDVSDLLKRRDKPQSI